MHFESETVDRQTVDRAERGCKQFRNAESTREVRDTREISIYDVKLMFASWFRHIRRMSRERSNEGILFTLIASYKSDKSARLPETFSIGSLPWPIPKYTYFIYERGEDAFYDGLSRPVRI
jgi:hypothetical protein